MKDIVVSRDLFFDNQASLGTLLVYDGSKQIFKCDSLERGWVNNENMISCIPTGTYKIVLEHSPRFKKELWEIKGVPGRSECKIHIANYFWQLNGCIALGGSRKYIDKDLVMDVANSRNTVNDFHKIMGNDTEAKIHIVNLLDYTI